MKTKVTTFIPLLSILGVAVALIGYLMLGTLATLPTLLLAIGAAIIIVSYVKEVVLGYLVGFFFYIGAGCMFLSAQIFTISNVLTAIDASSFEASFIVSATGTVMTLVLGLVGSVFTETKN